MPITSSGASRREIPGQDTDARAAQRDEGQTGATSSEPVSSAPGVSNRGGGQTGATNREPVSTAPGVHHRGGAQTGATSIEPTFTNASPPDNRPLLLTCDRTARYLTIRVPSPAPGHGRPLLNHIRLAARQRHGLDGRIRLDELQIGHCASEHPFATSGHITQARRS